MIHNVYRRLECYFSYETSMAEEQESVWEANSSVHLIVDALLRESTNPVSCSILLGRLSAAVIKGRGDLFVSSRDTGNLLLSRSQFTSQLIQDGG